MQAIHDAMLMIHIISALHKKSITSPKHAIFGQSRHELSSGMNPWEDTKHCTKKNRASPPSRRQIRDLCTSVHAAPRPPTNNRIQGHPAAIPTAKEIATRGKRLKRGLMFTGGSCCSTSVIQMAFDKQKVYISQSR